jgi:hypothetical protein
MPNVDQTLGEEEGMGDSLSSPLLVATKAAVGRASLVVAHDEQQQQQLKFSLYMLSTVACVALLLVTIHLLQIGTSAGSSVKPEEKLLARMDFTLLPHQVRIPVFLLPRACFLSCAILCFTPHSRFA